VHKTPQFQAPQLTGTPNRVSEAFGAAVWLWMQHPRHRETSIRSLQRRLLEPVQQGQYVLASVRGTSGQGDPVALLLYACLNAQAESRYLKDPTAPLAHGDWRSGDRLWLIDWVSPFGHSLQLRRRMLALFARQTARSLRRYPRAEEDRVQTWLGETCTPQGAQSWWQERPILNGPQSTPSWPGAASWEPTVPAELLVPDNRDRVCA
jgi:cytolysin-activating lysine-acyltransferase